MTLMLVVLLSTAACAEPRPSASCAAPSFQDLMRPDMLPQAQGGMRVEQTRRLRADGVVQVLTTGGDFRVYPQEGRVRFGQRLGTPRELVVLETGRPWEGVELAEGADGFQMVTVQQPRLTLRINGDSLFMLHAHEPLQVESQRRIRVAWHASAGPYHLLADELGGFGLYASPGAANDHFEARDGTVARYTLPADEVLWVAVCPPKPYDWERSLTDRIVWHWSATLAYPPNETLRAWQPHANLALLQSEVMAWKDWGLDFVPRLGADEFARVRDTLHELGMQMIVYTSPYYFLKGTSLESQVVNSFEDGVVRFHPGLGTGENMELFMEAITRLWHEHRPDGLYYDGVYSDCPAALYALARRSRELVGEDGILYWHSTLALGGQFGPALCYLPQADAYVDFIMRGEGQISRYTDDYLRFFVSGYNLSNSIGVLCNNAGVGYPPELTERLLRFNGRYPLFAWVVEGYDQWEQRPEMLRLLQEHYFPRLNENLRDEVAAGCAERQALLVP